MTAKEYLMQAYFLDQRINSEIAEVERLRKTVCGISVAGFEERLGPRTATEAPFVRALEKIWMLEKKINEEIDRLGDLKVEIRNVIEALPDINERMTLRFRYIHNMTWEQIGDKLHADPRTIRRWRTPPARL